MHRNVGFYHSYFLFHELRRYVRKVIDAKNPAILRYFCNHREDTILLSMERVNKGTKRMNSLRTFVSCCQTLCDLTEKTATYKFWVTFISLYCFRPMSSTSNSSLWKRVIAWERSRAASAYGIIWGDAGQNKHCEV